METEELLYSFETKTRYLLVLKRYTRLGSTEVFDLLAQEFGSLTEERQDELEMVFYRAFPDTFVLRNFGNKLKDLSKLDSQELVKVKQWLMKYLPEMSTEEGIVPNTMRCDIIKFERQQTKFLLVLKPLLKSINLIRSFQQEFETSIPKNFERNIYTHIKIDSPAPVLPENRTCNISSISKMVCDDSDAMVLDAPSGDSGFLPPPSLNEYRVAGPSQTVSTKPTTTTIIDLTRDDTFSLENMSELEYIAAWALVKMSQTQEQVQIPPAAIQWTSINSVGKSGP